MRLPSAPYLAARRIRGCAVWAALSWRITDNAQARECARTIASWKPPPPRPVGLLAARVPQSGSPGQRRLHVDGRALGKATDALTVAEHRFDSAPMSNKPQVNICRGHTRRSRPGDRSGPVREALPHWPHIRLVRHEDGARSWLRVGWSVSSVRSGRRQRRARIGEEPLSRVEVAFTGDPSASRMACSSNSAW